MLPYAYFSRNDGLLYLSPSLASGDGDSLSNDIAIMSGDVALVLVVNKDTYTDLLSSALNGAIDSYPDNWPEIIYPLIKAGKMVFCEQVADCIENSSAVSISLQKFLNAYASGGNTYNTTNYALSPEEIEGQLLPPAYVCDNDHLMGMARYIVQSINYAVVEVLQSVELATTPIEALANLMDNVPFLELLGVFVEAFALAQDNLYTVYSAAYTQAIEDEITCQLYCAFVENCVVSVELVENAYRNVFDAQLPPVTEDLNAVVQWLVDNVLSLASVAVVAVCHLMVVEFIKHAAKFGNIFGLRTLEAMIQIGADEIDTSWVNCDPCGLLPDTGFYDWKNVGIDQYAGVTVNMLIGTYVPGAGMKPQQNPDGSGNNQYGTKYEVIWDTPKNINSITQHEDNLLQGSVTGRTMWLYDSSNTLVRTINAVSGMTVTHYTWNEAGSWNNVKKMVLWYKAYNSPNFDEWDVTVTT